MVETDLMKEYSVSRATIREVLRRLVEDEIVESIPNRGVRVRKLSAHELGEYYEILEYLEGLAIRLVAETHSDKILDELIEIIQQDEQAVSGGKYYDHASIGRKFHEYIASASGNRPLTKSIFKILTIVHVRHASLPLESRMETWFINYKTMVSAIQNHDADLAEMTMRRHVKESKDAIESIL